MDLLAFHAKAQSQKKAVKKVFQKLKRLSPKKLDTLFHKEHEAAFAEIDCLECANCCKTTGPLFTNQDIDRLAKHFNQKPADFINDFLRIDEDGDFVLQSVPCPFLGSDNYCSVYEARPKACRQFPHTDRNKMHQILGLTEKNARVCPAVARMVEKIEMKLP